MQKFFTLIAIFLGTALAVMAQDGQPDSSFAQTGVLLLDFANGNETGNGVIVQPDGKIVLLASARYPESFDVEVVRLNEDGSVDSTFATNGVIGPYTISITAR